MYKKKKIFIDGAITPDFIAQSISHHSVKTNIGAHSIFLGQIRADIIGQEKVVAIEYTAYKSIAEEKLYQIREDAFSKYNLTCMHIYHSLGRINVGEVCLFVFTSSKHRDMAITGCEYIVERIKKELPVWGKEILSSSGYQWKSNQN